MENYLIYLLTFFVLIIVDFLWLGLIAKKFYKKQFGNLMGKPKPFPAILTYILLVAGIIFFVQNIQVAFPGAIFGFFAYGIYDLTNLATLKKFSIKLAIIDWIWGTFLCGIIGLFVKLLLTL